jgi:TonB family protein
MVIQNSLFLGLVLVLLYSLRNKSPQLLRMIALFSMLKVFLPPLIPLPISNTTSVFLVVPEIFITAGPATGAPAASLSANVQTQTALSFSSVLLLVWLAIGIYILAAGLSFWFRLQRTIQKLQPVDVSKLISKQDLDNVVVYKSYALHSPMLVGWLKARIIMPKNWDDLSPVDQKTILLHELSHVTQKDHWINLLVLITFAFQYFNPLVWLLARRIRHYNELVCDDRTAAGMNQEPAAYSKSLLSISELLILPGREVLTTACFSETFHSVKRRITYQLQQQEGKTMKLSTWQKTATLTLMVMIFFFASLQCSKESPENLVADQSPVLEEKVYKENEVDRMAIPKQASLDGLREILLQSKKGEPTGELIFFVVVKKDGRIELVKSIKSITGLEQVLEADLKKWQWQPAEIKGKPVACSGICVFNINSDYTVSIIRLPGMNNRKEKLKERLGLIEKYEKGSDEIFEFFAVSVSTKPEIVEKKTPIYPEKAREDSIQGRIVVTVTIGFDGLVESAEIFTNLKAYTPMPALEEAAIDAARQFVFTPALQRDKRVRVKMNLPFNFTLKK